MASSPPPIATKAFPLSGAMRLQPSHYPSPFKPIGDPTHPALLWLRTSFPSIFGDTRWGRFSDERGQFAETYAGTTLYDAAIEVFEKFRVEAYAVHLARSIRHPGGAVLPFRPGTIQKEEIENREVIELRNPQGDFADVMETVTQNWVSRLPRVASLVRTYFGKPVLDSSILTASGKRARAVTRVVSRVIFELNPPLGGIRYSSRIGQGSENWAIFERSNPTWRRIGPADPADRDIERALFDLDLTLG